MTTVTPATGGDGPSLFAGPPRYVASTPWKPIPAILVTVIVFLGQLVGVAVALGLMQFGPEWLASSVPVETGLEMTSPGMLTIMIASQMASIALVWLFAGWRGQRHETLQLSKPPRRWAMYLMGGLLAIAITGAIELVFYKGLGFDVVADTRDMVQGMRSDWWPLAVVMAVVFAPLWEELTFRGFLLSALAQTRLGFWGAALITNTAWTALHWNYSVAGLIAVFTAGSILTWLLWRSGSIRVPIAAHAIVNLFAVGFAIWLGSGAP